MRAVITVVGKDRVGIIAKVSAVLADAGVNILDISQTIMQDLFTMIMLTDLSESSVGLDGLKEKLEETGAELGVDIRLQHEGLFQSMHRI